MSMGNNRAGTLVLLLTIGTFLLVQILGPQTVNGLTCTCIAVGAIKGDARLPIIKKCCTAIKHGSFANKKGNFDCEGLKGPDVGGFMDCCEKNKLDGTCQGAA